MQLMRDTLALCKSYGTALETHRSYINTLQQITLRLENRLFAPSHKAIKQNQTKTLRALDEQRMEAIRGLHTVAVGYTHHFNQEKREHAKTLLRLMGPFVKAIQRQHSSEKTFRLRMITCDGITDASLLAALENLHLTNWFQRLHEVNQQFLETHIDTVTQHAQTPHETFSQLRPLAQNAWYKLCKHVNATALIYEHSEPYAKLIPHVNALLEPYRKLAASRRKSKRD